MKILLVAGARPNFMKVAPIVAAVRAHNGSPSVERIRLRLVHTEQHYDQEMSGRFFRDLRLPPPHYRLGAGSGTHARQTAAILTAFEDVCLIEKPDFVVVVGDVNSTLACALAAAKLGVRVVHVEAGLRSGDRSMPEEINRILTDHLSTVLFTSCPDGGENLAREGIAASRVRFVGNVMVDSLIRHLSAARRRPVLSDLGLIRNSVVLPFGLITLHRPANVDDPEALRRFLAAFREVGKRLPLLFPVHPRTRRSIAALGRERGGSGLRLLSPLAYPDMIGLMAKAALVLTDSGGVQEETTFLGVPCLTLRENTERPVTVREGTNRLAGRDPERIVAAAWAALDSPRKDRPRRPKLWDGRAAERIVKELVRLGSGGER